MTLEIYVYIGYHILIDMVHFRLPQGETLDGQEPRPSNQSPLDNGGNNVTMWSATTLDTIYIHFKKR